MSESGGVLSNATLLQVEDAINGYLDPVTLGRVMGYRAGGVRVEVKPPVFRPVDISVTIRSASNYNSADVKSLVEQGLGNFTTSFVLGQSLSVSELIQYMMNLHDDAVQDAKVTMLEGSSPATDVIASPNQLISLYNISVTVA